MTKVKQLPIRQRTRKALLFVSLLLFPLALYYFSPVLIGSASLPSWLSRQGDTRP